MWRMKDIFGAVAVIFCALSSGAFFQSDMAAAADLSVVRISLIEGDVQVRTIETRDWVAASINMPLADGDSLWVPDGGRVELNLKDGSYVRLDENSSLDVVRLEEDSVQFNLPTGRSYVNFMGVKGTMIQFETSGASVRAFERARFNIDTFEDGRAEISVFKGTVLAETARGSTKVNAKNSLSLTDGEAADLLPLKRPDAWEKWNTERDDTIYERRYSSRYLPDELDGYGGELDRNGNWVYVREYGYVWTPTVYVSAGWAPYRHGRWAWNRGDYIWISYEPWGWAPYHYGRWTFVISIGWCWVPPHHHSVYWGPGYVGWVHTPTYVGWVPLAPGEPYYGYGNYGPHSVNLLTVNIQQITVNQIYANAPVGNAVTIIHHDTFRTGRHMDIDVKENPFLRDRASAGRPDIRPERQSYLPVIKDIPAAKHPPKMIREMKAERIREQRPLVKSRGGSVMTPREPHRIMPVRTLRERPQKGPIPSERMPSVRELPQQERQIQRQEQRVPQQERQIQRQEQRVPQQERQIQRQEQRAPQQERQIQRQEQRAPQQERQIQRQEQRAPQQERKEQRTIKQEERREGLTEEKGEGPDKGGVRQGPDKEKKAKERQKRSE